MAAWWSWLLVWAACGVCCHGVRTASDPAEQSPVHAVVAAVSELPTVPRDAVVRQLFEAANGLFAGGDARGALRVMALCRRLENGNADIELAVADMHCRAGDLAGAHAGFKRAVALARQLCPEPTGRSTPDQSRCSQDELHEARGRLVSASARHGMCLMEARRFGAAAVRFRDALAIDQVRAPWLASHSKANRVREQAGERCSEITRARARLLVCEGA